MGPAAKSKPRLQQDHAKGLRRTDWGRGNGNLVFSFRAILFTAGLGSCVFGADGRRLINERTLKFN